MNNLFSVKNKRILITGGTSGLGKMMAEGFVDNDAKVLICGRNTDKGNKVADKTGCYFVLADVTQQKSLDDLLDKTHQYLGGLDVLINNAGISPTRDNKVFSDVINTNLKAMIDLSEMCLPILSNQAEASKIINISSVAGINPPPLKNYGYTTSKAGAIVFTKQFAKKAISRNVVVNAIAPGFFKTPMTSPVLKHFEGKILGTIPMNRLGQQQDIVGLSLFLASQASNYIVGQTIVLDGGMSIN